MTAIQDKAAQEFDAEKAWNYIKSLRDAFDKQPSDWYLISDLTPEQIKEIEAEGYTIRKIYKDEI